MTPNLTPTSPSLEDVLYALSLESDSISATILDEFVRRYPHYGAELTNFAIELAIDHLRFGPEPPPEGTDAEEDRWSPAVERAMSRFQNRLYTETHPQAAPVPASTDNPFRSLDRAAFRDLAKRLDVNTVFLMKLRDRQISPETIPNALCLEVANELAIPVPILQAHFHAPPDVIQPNQHFKATNKPRGDLQESFSDAARNSGLTKEQARRLLSL